MISIASDIRVGAAVRFRRQCQSFVAYSDTSPVFSFPYQFCPMESIVCADIGEYFRLVRNTNDEHRHWHLWAMGALFARRVGHCPRLKSRLRWRPLSYRNTRALWTFGPTENKEGFDGETRMCSSGFGDPTDRQLARDDRHVAPRYRATHRLQPGRHCRNQPSPPSAELWWSPNTLGLDARISKA
jgi:hypothetical protein